MTKKPITDLRRLIQRRLKVRSHGAAADVFFFAATSWKCLHGVAVDALLLHDANATAMYKWV